MSDGDGYPSDVSCLPLPLQLQRSQETQETAPAVEPVPVPAEGKPETTDCRAEEEVHGGQAEGSSHESTEEVQTILLTKISQQ